MKVSSTKSVEMARIKALVYGKSGVGKTTTALTLKPEHTLILSAESGLLPLAGKEFTVWEIEHFDDLESSYQDLLKPENQKRFKTIFVDSLTEINELAKEKIVKKDRPALGKDPGKVYEDLMVMQDYQLLLTRMTRFIRAFRDLPYHVIFTCLEDNIKDERTGEVTLAPSLNGKLAINIAGYFDEVFRMITKEENDKINRYFVTDKVERAIAKDRSGTLILYETPSWSVVLKKILAKFNGKTQEAA